jgi:hypothetical protein
VDRLIDKRENFLKKNIKINQFLFLKKNTMKPTNTLFFIILLHLFQVYAPLPNRFPGTTPVWRSHVPKFLPLKNLPKDHLLHILERLVSIDFDQFRQILTRYYKDPEIVKSAFQKLKLQDHEMPVFQQYLSNTKIRSRGPVWNPALNQAFDFMENTIRQRLAETPKEIKDWNEPRITYQELLDLDSFSKSLQTTPPPSTLIRQDDSLLKSNGFPQGLTELVDLTLSLPVSTKAKDAKEYEEEWIHIPKSNKAIPQSIFKGVLAKYGDNPAILASVFQRLVITNEGEVLEWVQERILKLADEQPDKWPSLRQVYVSMEKQLKELSHFSKQKELETDELDDDFIFV